MGIEKYLNIPFVRHQHEPHGFDCWGLIVVYYRQEHGIELPNHPLSVAEQIWDDIPREEVKLGDAVGWGTMGISHVGLMLDKDTILHTTSGVGYSHIKPYSEMPAHKLIGFMRLKPDYKPILT